jgi:lysine 2,3-aminomutase
LRRTHTPTGSEYLRSPGEADDPLGEDHDSAVPGLVHRHPDHVLFLATGTCSTYCRYCTRSRAVGDLGGEYALGVRQWDAALDYIAAHPEIHDVLISGGYPLTLSDDKLDYLLGRLKAIQHVELVRIYGGRRTRRANPVPDRGAAARSGTGGSPACRPDRESLGHAPYPP